MFLVFWLVKGSDSQERVAGVDPEIPGGALTHYLADISEKKHEKT